METSKADQQYIDQLQTELNWANNVVIPDLQQKVEDLEQRLRELEEEINKRNAEDLTRLAKEDGYDSIRF